MSAAESKKTALFRRADLLLIAGLLLLALGLFAAFRLFGGEGAYAVVTVDGRETGRYPLSESGRFELNGGSNILVIEDGAARVTEANCPDKLCVRQGAISRSGETIVCLPNRLVVTVVGAEDRGVDAVS